MEEINRELLIKEISSRLAYGIKAQVLGWDEEKGEVEVPLKVYSINTDGYLSFEYNHYSVETVYVEDCHLYLRPMSSMTKEEEEEQDKIVIQSFSCSLENSESSTTMLHDWLLSKHFDVRGLINKNLALEAPEDMYKIK